MEKVILWLHYEYPLSLLFHIISLLNVTLFIPAETDKKVFKLNMII